MKNEEPKNEKELIEPELEEQNGGIDTVPLPRAHSHVAIGTWPTPERPHLADR